MNWRALESDKKMSVYEEGLIKEVIMQIVKAGRESTGMESGVREALVLKRKGKAMSKGKRRRISVQMESSFT